SGLRTIEGRNFDGPAKGCRRHRKRHLAVQVGAVALEKFMRPAGQENVEVARRSAVKPGLALAGDADAGAILDSGGNIDGKGALLAGAALTLAGATGIADRLAAAVALRTGALDREEALGGTHAPGARTQRTGDRRCAGFRSGARAGGALNRGRNVDLGCLARPAFLQRDFHIVAQIGAAPAAIGLTALPSAHHLAENIFENVGKPAG